MSKKRKETYALFSPDQKGARIYVNPSNLEALYAKGTVLKINDRDKRKLKGISPSDWEHKGGKIVHAKSSDLYKEVKMSVHEHALPEVQPIEIKEEYIIIEPKYGKMAAMCAIIGAYTGLLTFLGFAIYLGAI